MHHLSWGIIPLVVVLVALRVVAFVRRRRHQKWLQAQAEAIQRKREGILAMFAEYDLWDWIPIRDPHLTTLFGSPTYEAFELTVVAGGVWRLEEPKSDEQLYTGCVLSHCRRHKGEPDKWARVLEFDRALDPIYFRLIRFHRFMDKHTGNVRRHQERLATRHQWTPHGQLLTPLWQRCHHLFQSVFY